MLSDDSHSRLPQTMLRMLLTIAQKQTEPGDVQALLPDLVQGFGASAAAAWSLDNDEPHVFGEEQSAFTSAAAIRQGVDQLARATPNATAPVSMKPAGFSPERTLLTIPYIAGDRSTGCVQLLLPNDVKADLQLATLQTAKLVAIHLSNLSDSRDTSTPHSGQLEALLRFHDTLDLQETSYAVANDARSILGCDRVSVLLKRRNGFRLESASGQVQPDQRANTVRQLRSLVERVASYGEPFEFSSEPSTAGGRDRAPQIEQALNDYLDLSPTRSIRILPLYESEQPLEMDAPTNAEIAHRARAGFRRTDEAAFGAIVLEQFSRSKMEVSDAWIDMVASAASRALRNSQAHERIFMLPVWRTVGRWWSAPEGRWLRRLGLFAVVAAMAAMWFVPARFEIVVDGKLEPSVRRHIFSTASGVVQQVLVEHGDQVDEDQIVVRLDNPELTRNVEDVLGQIQIARQQLSSVTALRLSGATVAGSPDSNSQQNNDNRLAAEQQRLEMQLQNLERQHDLLELQQQQMEIRSPLQGTVVTWDVEQAIASRPLERGQQLMTIADGAGPWQLNLLVRDRQAGHLRQAIAANNLGEPSANGEDRRTQPMVVDLPVSFALATEPSGRYRGRLNHVSESSQYDPDLGSSVKVTVALDASQLPTLHDGAGVRAKIDCGQRRLGYVWFHQMIDLLHSHILFYVR